MIINIKKFLVLLNVLLGCISCGYEQGNLSIVKIAPQPQLNSPIVNGEICTKEKYQSTVAIIAEIITQKDHEQLDYQRFVICSGALIAPDVVLSAAHCFDLSGEILDNPQLLEINFYISRQSDLTYLSKKTNSSKNSKETRTSMTGILPSDAIKAISWLSNPNFFSANAGNSFSIGPANHYDIGLLFLAKTSNIKPAKLIDKKQAQKILKNKLPVEIAGYGKDSDQGIPGLKRQAKSFINDLGDFEMQIGNHKKTSFKCGGDSGGPTFANIQNEYGQLEKRLIGVTTRTYDGQGCNKGTLDTRVDAHLSWIDAQLIRACLDNTRVWCDEKGIIKSKDFWDKYKVPFWHKILQFFI